MDRSQTLRGRAAAAPDDAFPANLALLCSYEGSIAAVCRRIGINRAQFNRYLAGRSEPSRRNLRRICDHFGVSEAELRLPHAQFAEIVALKPARPAAPGMAPPLPDDAALIRAHTQPLPERYLGYYHRYFYAGVFERAVTKSLVRIVREGDRVLWKNVERAHRSASTAAVGSTYKYRGEAFLLSERIHVIEYETIRAHNFCYTVLYPSYGNHLTWLNGLQSWLSLGPGRRPIAATVALKFLGRRVDVRKALSTCGTFRDDDPRLAPDLADKLDTAEHPQRCAMVVNEAWT